MELQPKMIKISQDKLKFLVLESGDIYKVLYDNLMLNMYPSSYYDGSLYNIYLKVDNKTSKLMGIDSPSKFAHIDNKLVYIGNFEGIDYQVVFNLFADSWFVDVILKGNKKASIYYCFDVGLANEGINEAYNCQYIDHNVIDDNGYIHILSKQNQGRPMMLETSSFNKLDSYSTDGFQFFKKEYKITNYPEALKQEHLDNYNYQYEFAYLVLKSKDTLINQELKYTFYHKVKDNYHIFPSDKEDIDKMKNIYQTIKDVNINSLSFNKLNKSLDYNDVLISKKISKEEIDNLFKEQRNVETNDKNELLSMFSKDNSYIVFQDFEKYLKRPTGIVYSTNGFKKIDSSPLAFTCYMYGMFASHIVLGNTDFNLFTHESKTPLNVYKSRGLRILVEIDGTYKLLTMPAAFKMDINMATWYYKINDDLIIIKSAIAYEKNQIEIEINSKNNIKYNFIISNYLHMNNALPEIKQIENGLSFYFDKTTMVYQKYPNLHYNYQIINNKFKTINDDFSDNYPFIINQIDNANNVKLLISASYGNDDNFKYEDIDSLKDNYYKLFKNNICNISVTGNNKFISKVDDIIMWYVQNALIHYASPHGLEQCFGAAWGLRDVLQGPLEMFLSFKAFDIARDILLKVFSRQFVHNYDWPQWFMFDKYKNIQAEDSHGDIIVWPLKAISNYILQTNDLSILSEEVPYFDFYQGNYSNKTDAVFDHIKNELLTIEKSFIDGYNLPSYGNGDWDDTLQPKDKEKAKKMVSGWTVALLLDGLKDFIDCLKYSNYDITYFMDLYNRIKIDYNKYIIKDNVPAGFIYLHDDKIEYMLHPLDDISKIKYRLLPLTRGMIASLYDNNQINKYLSIIDDNLIYSDGVRLMSSAIKYKGGKNDLFKRAETASNFGREISLQYVHAHIRYLEAMAFIGKNDRLYQGLQMITPIKINEYVKNAMPRQGNVYFSSSDGCFINRYDAYQNFAKLKNQEVMVDSGWRLYSSGPGIYLSQLITHFFGIDYLNNKLYINPIMDKSLDNTVLNIQINNKNLTFVYHLENDLNRVDKILINNVEVSCNHIYNIYRKSGIIIDDKGLKDNSIIDIYCN